MGTKGDGMRVPFGCFLVERGIISAGELEAALIIQDDKNPRIGRLAQRRDMLTFTKLCEILEYQRAHGVRFGKAAVELGFLSEHEVAELVEEQLDNRVKLGELLVELNVLTPAKLRQSLHDHALQHGLDRHHSNGHAKSDSIV